MYDNIIINIEARFIQSKLRRHIYNDYIYQNLVSNATVTVTVLGCQPRSSTTPGLGVYKWSPEEFYYKIVSWIPNTDEMLKLLKKKMN